MREAGDSHERTRVKVSFFFAEATRQRNDLMEQREDEKEVGLAVRGVEAYIDRANELHHQGKHPEAFKQLEVRVACCVARAVLRARGVCAPVCAADGAARLRGAVCL